MTRPSIFADIGLDAALERAKGTAKLVLVAVTWESSEACASMDRTTWAHDDVVAAVREHAIAIQVDDFADHDAIKHFRVTGLPTTIALQGGREIDRVIGALEPSAFVDWLHALKRGETSVDRSLASKPTDVRGRLDLASKLLTAQRLDEALAEYVWLWENVPVEGPPAVSTRHGELVYQIQHLVESHPPARAAFSALRDRAAPPATGTLSAATLHDWFSLSGALGKNDETFAWFETVGKTLEAEEEAQELLEKELAGHYVATKRWADVGRLFKDPVRHLRGGSGLGGGGSSPRDAQDRSLPRDGGRARSGGLNRDVDQAAPTGAEIWKRPPSFARTRASTMPSPSSDARTAVGKCQRRV